MMPAAAVRRFSMTAATAAAMRCLRVPATTSMRRFDVSTTSSTTTAAACWTLECLNLLRVLTLERLHLLRVLTL
jgi:hypothetical protein